MSLALKASALRVWRGSAQVLGPLELTLGAGRRLGVVGANGAGKTSLLLACVGALGFTGELVVAGHPLTRATLEAARAATGLLFAEPSDQLFCETVGAELAFAPQRRGLPPSEVAARVAHALSAMALEGLRERCPRELSLGEQRRVALASVLTAHPRLLLLDEPTSSLDPRARRQVLEGVAGLEAAVVVATHDLDALLDLGGDVLLLRDGQPVALGPAERLLRDEALLDAAGLMLPLSLQRRAGGPEPPAGRRQGRTQ